MFKTGVFLVYFLVFCNIIDIILYNVKVMLYWFIWGHKIFAVFKKLPFLMGTIYMI